MNSLEELRSLPSKVQVLRDEIKDLIKNLPQNPDITPAGSGFTMSIRKLSPDMNLSPYYYDFKFQYEEIIKVIDNTQIENLDERVKRMLVTGKINNDYRLHSQVLETLRRIWL